ncbi:beta-propeller fold lactonase family protein [Microbacterium sp. SSW1-59]|uniref:lactonase family protein n=1 Tax=Microbacterium xanthum TaxID=3079794 RepID=UPI002AD48701|nr:beta-propeller fold lactonase family protein [Microbacterium sp. SSW1-59]MDZ8200651.1 beta-propeller fold lactonase family protein [Microbacterium sp. SSW1-59]
MRLFTGGYTADMGGEATGIGMLHAGSADTAFVDGPLGFGGEVVSTDSPSWLAAHPTRDVIYAALEKAGAVQAFRRTGESTLVALGGPVPAGAATCHVAVAPDGGSLLASCWGDGGVVRMTLDADGRPFDPRRAPAASDPYDAEPDLDAIRAQVLGATAEEAGEEPDARPSRAHEARYLPDGTVVTTDLGLDLVRIWRPVEGRLRAHQQVALPRGCGPRHTAWHPSGHLYVVTEFSGEVFVLAPGATGSWRILGGVPLGALPGDTGAEIALGRDGSFVYAGLRGSDTMAVLRVRGGGDVLEPTALVETGVAWPRHHMVARDTLLVAGERSHEVAASTLDPRTGVPGRVRHRTTVPSPTHLLPVR